MGGVCGVGRLFIEGVEWGGVISGPAATCHMGEVGGLEG